MIMLIQIAAFVGIGALAGLLAGLLGISGGIIAIPCLVYLFHYIGVPDYLLMHLAIGTSLAAMILNSLASMISHHRRQGVRWKVVRGIIPGIVLGSVLGAFIAKILPGDLLRIIFGVFECGLGLRFLWPTHHGHSHHHKLPHAFGLSLIGLCISTFSTMMGIGGGILVVPTLTYFHVQIKKAIGTAAATGFFITLIGAISFFIFGLQKVFYPYAIGYLYWPGFIVIAIVSVFFAPLGVKLVHTIPKNVMKKIFGAALFIAGIALIIQ